jgi:CHAD domain-containing protein
MESFHLRQSNVASLPPPVASTVAGMLKPPENASSVTAFQSAPERPLDGSAARTLAAPLRDSVPDPILLVAPAVGACLAKALDARWKSYRQQLSRCREECSEEAVHELRVATRRLIAQLALLSCAVHTTALDKARRVLKRRLVSLGDLRDTHVQRQFISQYCARFPELGLLRKSLERQERRLVKAVAARVGSWKTRKLEKWMDAVSLELAVTGRGSRAQDNLAAAVLQATADAFAQAVERRQAIDLADLCTIHQTRIAFKRFRYMVESLSPDITGLSKRDLRALAYYQRKMGNIQDLEVLQACIAKYNQQNEGAEALLAPFENYLCRRRARALQSFLKSADRLSAFWPPAKLSVAKEPETARNAA